MKKKTKKVAKKQTSKKKGKSKVSKSTPKTAHSKHEIVVRVQTDNQPAKFLKESDLNPEKEGGKYMIPKTWLSEKQVLKMVHKTPPQHVYKRPAKGGGQWDYLTGAYVTKVLNFTFGWNWDIETINEPTVSEILEIIKFKLDQIWVTDKLTVKDDKGHTIIKTQTGRSEIKFKKGTRDALDVGNDLKAAHTDALKKCASLLGIGSDIYGKNEYKQEANRDIQPDRQTPPPANLPAPKASTETRYVKDHSHDEPIIDYVCVEDGNDISKAEGEYSKKMFGRMLCRNHQKEAQENKK